MSYLTLRNLSAVVLLIGVTETAQASVACPTSAGHFLRSPGGGTLYDGPVEEHATLAPSRSWTGSEGFVNTWHFVRSPENITLVCRYAGTPEPFAVRLTSDIRACRQDKTSFVCR